MADAVRWWDMRPAQSRQPKTYECPICHGLLLAMNPNTLLFPEGDPQRRRHAHTACVAKQRQAGKLLTKAEWERSCRAPRPGMRSWWRRLFGSRLSGERGAE
ncbi:MAG: hypothetical protein M0Z51_08500 [Propionibacterium sp.]|nr:hypothetical protein [Propionibacterium sp.]